jgi:hypothetical protein
MSKRTAVLAGTVAFAAVGVLTGCSVRPDHELEHMVEIVAPSAPSNCEWGSSSFDGDPDKWLGCQDSRKGTLAGVAAAVQSQLRARGFTVRDSGAPHVVRLTATRGGKALCVDALEAGFTRGRNTAAADFDVGAGEVLLDVWATKPYATAGRCAALPPFEE